MTRRYCPQPHHTGPSGRGRAPCYWTRRAVFASGQWRSRWEAPTYIQRAGIAAIELGDRLIVETRARLQASRDALVGQLARIPGIECAPPDGAMYLFFRIAGRSDDSLYFAKRLVTEVGLGLAPGAAFGPEGEGNLRWCFAAQRHLIDDGVARLARFLG